MSDDASYPATSTLLQSPLLAAGSTVADPTTCILHVASTSHIGVEQRIQRPRSVTRHHIIICTCMRNCPGPKFLRRPRGVLCLSSSLVPMDTVGDSSSPRIDRNAKVWRSSCLLADWLLPLLLPAPWQCAVCSVRAMSKAEERLKLPRCLQRRGLACLKRDPSPNPHRGHLLSLPGGCGLPGPATNTTPRRGLGLADYDVDTSRPTPTTTENVTAKHIHLFPSPKSKR